MNSIEILNTVNVISISISNLRFCDTLPVLSEACQSIWADLHSIQFSISHDLYSLLKHELRRVHFLQLHKIQGIYS